MGKLFGTDGIRGIVNEGLDFDLAYKTGLAIAAVLDKQKSHSKRCLVAIGKDTRISGDLLRGALVAGLCTGGADVLDLGTLPTPGVAWATVDAKADAGIVISASHNPFEHNGIKVFDERGYKLADELEEKIEDLVLFGCNSIPMRKGSEIGKVHYLAPRICEEYIDHLASCIDNDLDGLRILVDCANGAAYTTAAKLFDRFDKLTTDVINADPNGVNINDRCGSTHMDALAAMVTAGRYDIGIAFDGDADRCLAVDEKGNLIDGDQILAAIGQSMKKNGTLKDNTIVATVMSNLGFHLHCAEHNLKTQCTNVGDRHVLERMLEMGYTLGGEQSGHLIFTQHATTGDGQLAALKLLAVLKESGMPASALFGACPRYPQVLINVAISDNDLKKAILESDALSLAIQSAEQTLGEQGRVLVRPSGTEALIRVMVEAKTQEIANTCAEEIASIVRNFTI